MFRHCKDMQAGEQSNPLRVSLALPPVRKGDGGGVGEAKRRITFQTM